jgi:hypothetical protein
MTATFQHAEYNGFSIVARRHGGIGISHFVAFTLKPQFASLVHVASLPADEGLIHFNRRRIRTA